MTSVTAVVPCRDAAATLPRCLDALRSGTAAPDDLVVVDDGSRDGSASIAERHGARVVRVERARGPGAARNLGVAGARSAWILFIDADVEIEPGALALALEVAGQRPGAGVQGGYAPDCAGLGPAGAYKHRQQLENIARLGRGYIPLLGSSLALVRRAALAAAGGFREDIGCASVEDRLLGLRLHEAGTPLFLEPRVRGRHLHDYTLAGLLRADFGRARDEIRHWKRLGAARGYVHPRKRATYAAFLAGCAAVAAAPAAGAALLAGAVAVDVAALSGEDGRWDASWPLISLLDQAAVCAGAAAGAVELALARSRA